MSHPEPETLAAYHAGELTADEEQRLQDHLLSCRECSDLLLDLDGLADPGFGAGSLAPADQEALWGRIQGEIGKEPEEKPLAPVVPLHRPSPTSGSPRWLQALAAALLVATVGLSAWVASLQRTVSELSQAQPNPSVIQLSPATTRSGRGSRGEGIATDDSRRLILVLYLPGPPARATPYRAEIVRQDGGKVLEIQGLVFKEKLDGVTLELSRDELAPGDYRLLLFGSTGQGAPEKPIAEYRLPVEAPRQKP